MTVKLSAPFPYYGGKSRWADDVWHRFGKPDVYSEPFAGSLAVLLACPNPARSEIVCDTNGFICNFWRAVSADPESVAEAADYPTIHQDLAARHIWLRKWGDENAHRLQEDPRYFDVEAAGWWVWGISMWIGSGWCSVDEHIPEKRPFIVGQGVNAQRILATTIHDWFQALADRLKRTVVLNRDWRSALTTTVLSNYPSGAGDRLNRCIVLDPPYRTEQRQGPLYQSDVTGTSDDVAVASYEWAVEHGDQFRICYFAHEGDFPVPPGWTSQVRDMMANRNNATVEIAMYSPRCIEPQRDLFGAAPTETAEENRHGENVEA